MSKHPNPDKKFVMICYRRYILGCKKKFGGYRRSARSLVHYRDFIQEYLAL